MGDPGQQNRQDRSGAGGRGQAEGKPRGDWGEGRRDPLTPLLWIGTRRKLQRDEAE